MSAERHLKSEVLRRAAALGFARAGVARAEELEEEGARLDTWIAAGRRGDMRWIARTAGVRREPRSAGMMPSARSVIVLALPCGAPARAAGPAPARIARYARGRDYHNVAGKRARKIARFLSSSGHSARPCVDRLPLLERAWAARAGVGFVGKNCCLIVPGIGSHVVLAAVLTSAELPPDEPMRERCGTCRACLDACPTSAFVGAHELDARQCISYLTIEHRGPIPEALRAPIGDRLFGCDECQDVCPFSRSETGAAADPAQAFALDPRWVAHDAPALLRLDEPAFAALTEATPLRRPGREGLARNAAVVLGNSGDRVHLPVLREAAAKDPSPIVREAALWAVARLGGETE